MIKKFKELPRERELLQPVKTPRQLAVRLFARALARNKKLPKDFGLETLEAIAVEYYMKTAGSGVWLEAALEGSTCSEPSPGSTERSLEAARGDGCEDMTLNADSYFHIGQAHLTSGTPCQDYALSGCEDGAAYAVVSDGCSTGGHTDVGARVLTWATAAAIRAYWRTPGGLQTWIGSAQTVVSDAARSALGLQVKDMLATCLYLVATEEGARSRVLGDGVIAWVQRESGDVVMRRYEWQGNMPFYPAYREEALSRFVEAHASVEAAVLFCEAWKHLASSGDKVKLSSRSLTLREGIAGVTDYFAAGRDHTCIAVFSDGVTQIEGMDWKDAVVRLLSFKTTTGEFAKRRMIRVIKDSQKEGRGPLDDISYAVIRF
jgi:hypothetical protein